MCSFKIRIVTEIHLDRLSIVDHLIFYIIKIVAEWIRNIEFSYFALLLILHFAE